MKARKESVRNTNFMVGEAFGLVCFCFEKKEVRRESTDS